MRSRADDGKAGSWVRALCAGPLLGALAASCAPETGVETGTGGTSALTGGAPSSGGSATGGTSVGGKAIGGGSVGGGSTGGSANCGATAGPTPTGLAAIPSNGNVGLEWTPVTGATSYNVYWSTSSGVTPSTGQTLTGIARGYVHRGLTNGTTYYYVVTAVTPPAVAPPNTK